MDAGQGSCLLVPTASHDYELNIPPHASEQGYSVLWNMSCFRDFIMALEYVRTILQYFMVSSTVFGVNAQFENITQTIPTARCMP